MSNPHLPADEVHVRELPRPGSARLFQVTLSDGTLVSIGTDPAEPGAALSLTPPAADEAVCTVRCSPTEAATLAALLAGVRFVVHAPHEVEPTSAANLRTVTLPAGSPAVGRTIAEIEVPHPDDAQVIAVIRDDTPELLEGDPQRTCQPGDRLVIVGRPGSMSELVLHLLG
jgi:K+/H+ antiporter YhaU regulatory subunit KhtT